MGYMTLLWLLPTAFCNPCAEYQDHQWGRGWPCAPARASKQLFCLLVLVHVRRDLLDELLFVLLKVAVVPLDGAILHNPDL